MDQLTLGQELRDRGVERVLAHEEEVYKHRTLGVIAAFALTGEDFTADDVRAVVGDPPHHPNVLSALFRKARQIGIIVPVGIGTAQRKSRHAGLNRVWRGA
jgi:hypothetical protein